MGGGRSLRERRMMAEFFRPIPVAVRTGLSPDDRLLAAWEGLPDPRIEGVQTVREARRRLIRLRRERGIGPDGRSA